jgi:hypothetical protein
MVFDRQGKVLSRVAYLATVEDLEGVSKPKVSTNPV